MASDTKADQLSFFVVKNNKEQSSKRIFLLTSHHRLLSYKQEFCANPFLVFPPNHAFGRRKTGYNDVKERNMSTYIIRGVWREHMFVYNNNNS